MGENIDCNKKEAEEVEDILYMKVKNKKRRRKSRREEGV